MEHLDTVLSVWETRMGEFPVGLRKREETGCCNTYAVDIPVDPDTGGPHA